MPLRVAGLLAVVTCLTIFPSVGAEASPVGTLDGWGYNRYGQVGNGLADQPAVPAPANNTFFSDVVAIAAGANYSVALRADGTVWAWGHNNRGQLGSDTSSCSVDYSQERAARCRWSCPASATSRPSPPVRCTSSP